MAKILARFSNRIMFPLSIGMMDVNIGSKINLKCCELRDWGIENMFGVVYLSVAGAFFTKKVTPIIGVFPSANFPQEKLFSPSNQFFPTLI